jgi:hypothetical protein
MPNAFTAFWLGLSNADQPRSTYLGRALLADLPVTVAVSFAITKLTSVPAPGLPWETLPEVLLAMCVFAPLVETFGMAVIFWVLRRLLTCPKLAPWVTALVCAGLHSLARPLWGLEVFWGFVIFSLCYLAWEKKSPLQAFCMTAILHALHNLVPTLALAVFYRAG